MPTGVATFLDESSKLSTVEPFAQKLEAATKVEEVFQRLETQSGQKLQKVRTRGCEYLGRLLQEQGCCSSNHSSLHPRAEWSCRALQPHLDGKSQSYSTNAKLDQELWATAVEIANNIKNRSPSSRSAQTPWELVYGRKPDMSNMRVF